MLAGAESVTKGRRMLTKARAAFGRPRGGPLRLTRPLGGCERSERGGCCILAIPAFEQVAEAANGADMHAGRLDLRAQARYVHLDRVGRQLLVHREEVCRDPLPAPPAARPREGPPGQRPP